MHDFAILRDLVIIFSIALAVVPVLHRLRLPTIAGFIFVGVLVGPGALRFINKVHEVEVLAELGVVLLLFGIGLELSLDRLKKLWRPVLIGGSLQVSISIAATLAAATMLGIPWYTGLFLGFAVAVSSTAIVLRGLAERQEVDAPHGRLTLGVLVFQDLCVVPMMLAIPLLVPGQNAGGATAAVMASLKAVAVLVGVLVAARLLVPRALGIIAAMRQRDLFVLAVFVVCIGTAWVVSLAGISLALGAFLAGMVVAGSAYRHQAMADLIPFREVLTSLFFISVGMLLDPRAALANAGPIALVVLALIGGKFLVVAAAGALMRLPFRVTVLSAVALAQVGEFSFVLSRAAQTAGVLPAELARTLNTAAVITMLLTPLALAAGPHFAAGAGRVRWVTRLWGVESAAEADEQHHGCDDHVVIAGYGVAGRAFAKALVENGDTAYMVVDLNPESIREVVAAGGQGIFGDITDTEVLHHLHVNKARELVVAINDADAALRAVRAARAVAPKLHIMVRTRFADDVALLQEAGANIVVADEVEAARVMAAQVTRRSSETPKDNAVS